MYYGMISASALLFALQFLFNKGYQEECGGSWAAVAKFLLYTSLVGFAVMFAMNGFRFEVTLFSVIVACVYSAVCVVLSYSSIRAFEYANLSVYSVFSMVGGMLLPFVYGMLCGEEAKPLRILCCVLIMLSVIMSATGGGHNKKAVKYYIIVFFLNGMVGVISAFHQSFSELCVDSASFMMLTKIIIAASVLPILIKQKSFGISGKAFVYCSGYSVFNNVANLMLLIALLHLPASVQYPMVTGGVIVFSVLFDFLRKERVTKKDILCAFIALAASVLMAF